MGDIDEAGIPLDLALIDVALNRLGYTSQSDPAGGELTVQLADDRQLRQGHVSARNMAVRSVRIADDPSSMLRLLAFSTSYEFDAPENLLQDVAIATAELTKYAVLGHFEVDDDASLHLRYSTLMDSTDPMSDEMLLQLVSLLDYQQLHFGDYLQAICAGEVTVDVFADLVAEGESSGLD